MKITQELRDAAAKQGAQIDEVRHAGLEEKSREFVKGGAKIYR